MTSLHGLAYLIPKVACPKLRAMPHCSRLVISPATFRPRTVSTITPTPRLVNEACKSFDAAHGFLLLFSRVLFFYAYNAFKCRPILGIIYAKYTVFVL